MRSFTIVIFMIIFIRVAIAIVEESHQKEITCVHSEKIIELTKAIHRSVWVRVESGKEFELNQPSLTKPGDVLCLKFSNGVER